MTKIFRLFQAIAFVLVLGGCNHAELWDELPSDITTFISQYFPNSELESVTDTGSGYHVRIANGPGLTFGADNRWTAVNGFGMPLPQVFLFDRLPPKVYAYLQETDQINAVFAVSRDDRTYTLTLLDHDLMYDIATQQLSGTTPKG